MKTNGTGYLRPAIKLIAQTDPETFRRMKETDWEVHTVDEGQLFTALASRGMPAPEAYEAQLQFTGKGLGLTLVPNCDCPYHAQMGLGISHTTWMNRDHIERSAREMGANLTHLIAMVLIHEFDHREGGGEPSAYTAGSAFARKLHDPIVFAMSEGGRRSARMEELGLIA